VIKAHELNVWKQIFNFYDVYVPKTVIVSEARYFVSKDKSQRIQIDLSSDVKGGFIKELEASAEDVADLQAKVTPNFLEIVDPGEMEAISLLVKDNYADSRFCTGDQAAIKSLAALDISFRGISFENLLRHASISTSGLHPSYSEKAFQTRLADGLVQKFFYVKAKNP